MLKILAATAVATLGLVGAAHASTVTFDEYEHGDIITSLDLAYGVTATVTANGRSNSSPDQAWIFDTTLDNTADPDLEGPFTTDGLKFGHIAGRALIVQEHGGVPDDDGNGGWIKFSFSRAVTFLGFDFLDDEDVVARDNNGNKIVVGQPAGKAYDNYVTSSGLLAWENVTQLKFNFGKDSGAIDNLHFEIAPVPVPASLPLLLAGVAGFGVMSRRRKKA